MKKYISFQLFYFEFPFRGFFTGYWFTTGTPTITGAGQPYGSTSSLSNAIFVGGWYSKTTQFSMTSGTSGVYVAPQPCFGSIGDFVWNDYNANGIQDAGEPGISGATVTLNYPGGATSITTTGSTGAYLFSNPAAGTYSIAFSTPAGYSASPSNQGTDDTKDSDPISGSVSGIILTAGQNNTTIDAGFYLTTCIGQAPTFGLLGLSNGNFTIK